MKNMPEQAAITPEVLKPKVALCFSFFVIIRRVAKSFGANEVQLERVSKVQTAEDQEPVDPQDPFDPTEQRDRQ